VSSAPREPTLSVVIPVYNEEGSLDILHRELDAALAAQSHEVEFIFVDDGSGDGSLATLRRLAAEDSRLRVIALERNCGQSAALAAGFAAVRGEVTVMMDSDLQNDPADIPKLLARLKGRDGTAGADVVNGVRTQRDDSLVRRWSSRIANGFRNRMTGESVTDVGCSLRAMRTSTLRRVKMYRGMHRFLPTLLRMEGATLVEVPVAHRARIHGVSKYGIRNRLFVGLVDVFAVRWMQSRALRYRVKD
jgi:glycosyltransferase involved in cell wall biosynthesis